MFEDSAKKHRCPIKNVYFNQLALSPIIIYFNKLASSLPKTGWPLLTLNTIMTAFSTLLFLNLGS